ncbi:MarR family transcriptional regulator [Paenibacillus terrigena]|uniref:MarR family transcriptional regulator n=1 Tax=Paenibacillus terrigena TaxID=369333 RepID=UPI00036BF6BC
MVDKEAFFQQIVAFTTAVHEVTHTFTKDIKPDDITPLQYGILEYLAVSQPVTLSQISDCKHISMPNTSREIRKLCEKNLCEKFDAADDRRKQMIRLSEEGQAMMNVAFARIGGRFLERMKGASEEEWKDIQQAMQVLHTKVFY